MPTSTSMPSTVRRSTAKARRTWTKTYESALEQYGEADRARRVAFASLERNFEKVGDRWVQRPPSRQGAARTTGGVDENAPRRHLYELARRLGIRGRSRMSKAELADAIRRANERKTEAARRKD
ncbi:MAG: ChaB family protein [Acidothermus sp.]|nr:ChaB family protein [Acidothermus sp.]MCL6537430.1 ChaB family protein [Acidothermus sp.]